MTEYQISAIINKIFPNCKAINHLREGKSRIKVYPGLYLKAEQHTLVTEHNYSSGKNRLIDKVATYDDDYEDNDFIDSFSYDNTEDDPDYQCEYDKENQHTPSKCSILTELPQDLQSIELFMDMLDEQIKESCSTGRHRWSAR